MLTSFGPLTLKVNASLSTSNSFFLGDRGDIGGDFCGDLGDRGDFGARRLREEFSIISGGFSAETRKETVLS
jgi:hypothetical protein